MACPSIEEIKHLHQEYGMSIEEIKQHDPTISDEHKETCAMHWIDCLMAGDIPEEWRHDPKIKDEYERTCADHWRQYRHGVVPSYLL